ncbi:DUF6308 family protein [Phytohabitans flavus]|nr:DUF6308 family protein [Phytohabitans flavus]
MLESGQPTRLPEPSDDQVERVARKIDILLTDERTPVAVERYYDDASGYTGDIFLGLHPNEPYSIGTADLLAVALLDANPGPKAVRRLLPGGLLANHTSALLARIPLGVALWDATDDDLAWANELWSLVQTVDGVGTTIAGKIMARKRPELIPIVDGVVADQLRCERGTYWTTLRRILQDQELRARIASLQPHTPILRVLDTLMWMHWKRGGLA